MKTAHNQIRLFSNKLETEALMNESSQEIYLADPGFLIPYLEKIENISSEEIKSISEIFGADTDRPPILSIEGETAVIRIEGPLSRSGPSLIDRFFGFGGTSYTDIIKATQQIMATENAKETILLMNTPGGETSGVDEAYQAIKLLSSEMKVQAQNHGQIASAGYYLAVAATEIVSTAPMNTTGSIGTIAIGRDRTKFEEEIGIITVRIISDQSPDKGGIHTADGLKEIQSRVNAMTRIFIKRVSEGRNVSEKIVEKDFGRGGMLVAQDPDEEQPDAIRVGMIDGIIHGFADVEDTDEIESRTDTLNPVSTGQPTTEGHMDTLQELLAANPAVRVEYEETLKKARAEGATTADEAHQAKVKALKPYIGNTAYPEKIGQFAMGVLTGETDLQSFRGAVMVFDMNKEEDAQSEAEGETGKLKETAPGSAAQTDLKETGEIDSDAAFAQAVELDKKRRGLGV